VPVVLGGIEASLRRFAHYDYWSDTVRRSLLLDSKADILVYGMGEKPILEIARRLASGETPQSIADVRGSCIRLSTRPRLSEGEYAELPSYETVKGNDEASLEAYARHFMIQKENCESGSGRILIEQSGGRWVLQNPPASPLSQAELDGLYELPFTRRAHPSYAEEIPALKEAAFSLTASRGCFGGCSFCAITFHQGRAVVSRSTASLVKEAQVLTALDEFKGYIHDVGGPTANFFTPPCPKQAKGRFCPERECLFPEVCPRLKADHGPYLEALRALKKIKGVKKVFVRSGLRFDYLLMDSTQGQTFLRELCQYHVSGQLKVAPEHIAQKVLYAMGKTGSGAYQEFKRRFTETNKTLRLKQYLIPYFISSHPGSTLNDAVELALYLKKDGFAPDQVQDFYPTPGTLASVMFRTGLDPRTMERIFIARGEREKKLQRALLHFNRPKEKALARAALKEAGREDLIGFGNACLLPPEKPPASKQNASKQNAPKQGRLHKKTAAGRRK
jgi:uncharacterized radical SAM protein YgiQ